jgi:hypothetical protein
MDRAHHLSGNVAACKRVQAEYQPERAGIPAELLKPGTVH